MRRRRIRAAGGLLGALLLLLLITFWGVPAAGTAPPGSGAVASYDTGAMHVSLPGPSPNIQLAQDVNRSFGTNLTLLRLVELRSGSADGTVGPAVVAAAFPTDLRSYNVSASTQSGLQWVFLANLTVYRTGGVLFPTPNISAPLAPLIAISSTELNVTVSTDDSAGTVAIDAAITGWNLVDPGDLLALEWQFGVNAAAHYSACGAAQDRPASAAPCDATAFNGSASGWDDPITGLEGSDASGPIAALGWQATTTAGGSTTLHVGTAKAGQGQADVVMAATPSASGSIDFALDYALQLPALPAPVVVHGALGPYLGGAVAAAGAGLVGLLAFRVRERRLRDRL